ncbi:MAG: acyl-CoA/acyl-ACP dehydrogenase [Candidatus Heimdallarchaeota archaeon]|nr:acyl-CoA/acyl-ACP dehydrogenase [Candidatus Heimdallarchaeota archaeon]
MDQKDLLSINDSTNKNLIDKYVQVLGIEDEKVQLLYEVLDTIRTILERNNIHEKSMEWDEIGAKLVNGKVELPSSFIKILNELTRENEIVRMFLPEKMGGFGFTNLFAGPIIELISRYDFSLRIMSMSAVGISHLLLRYYKPNFDSILEGFANGSNLGYVSFTEPQAGSNLKNLKATSVLDGDEYILNGTKIYVSNGGYANTGLFLCNNVVNGKVEGTNVFIVEGRENITTLRLEKKSGIRINPTAQLLYEDVRVPKENLVGELGQGYSKVLERLLGMRAAVAFQALGAVKRSFKLVNNYANTREQFGKPIISFDDVSRKLYSIRDQIPRLEHYAYLSAYALDLNNYRETGDILDTSIISKPNFVMHSIPEGVKAGLTPYFVSTAKLYCAETSNTLMYDASQIFGGLGFISENEINKITRDIRVLSIYDGTSEIHNWIISRSQKLIEEIPDFQRPYRTFDDETVYDRMLFARFPKLKTMI